jgi:glycosyltransferase involved in cell wall biosynthesis
MISVVIPTLNEEKFIGILLDDLVKQNIDEDVEVIISDAGSTDKTKEIIEKYKNSFKKLSVVKGGKPAVSRNNGAKVSSGDPIFFIDADMAIPDKDFLKKAAGFFRNNKLGIGATYLKPKSDRRIDHFMVFFYNLSLPISKYIRPLGSMCVVASREVFNKTGGYPEDVAMSEDHDFCNTASKTGKYGAIPFPLVFSMRRFNKEGRHIILWKYLLAALHTVFLGPIEKEIFKYDFGDFKDHHDGDYDK